MPCCAMNPTGGARKQARCENKLSSAVTCRGCIYSAREVSTDYGPLVLGNRPVRTRMPGGVGAGGEIPPATRLNIIMMV
jgi:hypothetical protein